MLRFALLFPVWLVLALGEPWDQHACPMHGFPGASTVPASAAGEMHPGAHHHAPTPHPDQHAHHTCTCVGACTVGGAAVLPSAGTSRTPVVAVVPPGLPSPRTLHVSRDAHHRLPWPDGPPALS